MSMKTTALWRSGNSLPGKPHSTRHRANGFYRWLPTDNPNQSHRANGFYRWLPTDNPQPTTHNPQK